jgi:hypothetical protein
VEGEPGLPVTDEFVDLRGWGTVTGVEVVLECVRVGREGFFGLESPSFVSLGKEKM